MSSGARRARGLSDTRDGAGGPLAVSDQDVSPITEAFVAATAATCGVAVNRDFNGAEQEGAGLYQVTARGGVRASTAAAFLDPVRRARRNLTIIAGALVRRIAVGGGRARSVVLADRTLVADREIMLLSGIGPAAALRTAGVDVVHDLPGVGQNLQDHLLTGIMWEVTSAHARAPSVANLLRWIARYAISPASPTSSSTSRRGAVRRRTPTSRARSRRASATRSCPG